MNKVVSFRPTATDKSKEHTIELIVGFTFSKFKRGEEGWPVI